MSEAPENKPDPPPSDALTSHSGPVDFDALSSVLSLVRMRCEVVCSTELVTPFGLEFPAGPNHFHAVESGSAWVTCGSGVEPMRVGPGSCLLFPRGDGHAIVSTLDQPTRSLADAVREGYDRVQNRLGLGGGGEETRLVCARFRYENALAGRWLKTLPAVINIPAVRGEPSGLLEITSRALIGEVARPRAGAAIMIARLLDLLVVQMLRAWSAGAPDRAGWLVGAADPKIGRALAAIHQDPGHDWSVSELAAQVGMSRSSFAERFGLLVGEAPASYITNWRINLAADMLRGGSDPVNAIAYKVGYRSEAAFSRAFKARFGMAPIVFRHRRQPRDSASANGP